MQIDGSVIMWAFGLVFMAFTSLVGLIWAMLNKRLGSIEDQAKIDRDNMLKMVNQIYAEIKDSRDKAEDIENRMLAEMVGIRQAMNDLAVGSGDRRGGCIGKFAPKEELNRGLSAVRGRAPREE